MNLGFPNKGNHRNRMVYRVIPFLIPCLSHQQVLVPFKTNKDMFAEVGFGPAVGLPSRLKSRLMVGFWAQAGV